MIFFFFLKKWEFIVAIKSQRYLSTFCPTSKLNIDDITIKANGSLTTYKLFEVTPYGNGNHFKSAMCLHSPLVLQARWYEYDGLWEHYQIRQW